MENGDTVLMALEEFGKKPSDAVPTILEEYLLRVSRTGETLFAWQKVKPLLMKKLETSMKKFNDEMPVDAITQTPNTETVTFEAMQRSILNSIDNFNGAPFTMQRICELITDPKKHYCRTDKFLRGLEKNVLVVTTVDPWGRKISSDKVARTMVINGLNPNGSHLGDCSDVVPLALTQAGCPAAPVASVPKAAVNVIASPIGDGCGDTLDSAVTEDCSKNILAVGGYNNISETDNSAKFLKRLCDETDGQPPTKLQCARPNPSNGGDCGDGVREQDDDVVTAVASEDDCRGADTYAVAANVCLKQDDPITLATDERCFGRTAGSCSGTNVGHDSSTALAVADTEVVDESTLTTSLPDKVSQCDTPAEESSLAAEGTVSLQDEGVCSSQVEAQVTSAVAGNQRDGFNAPADSSCSRHVDCTGSNS